MKTVKEKIKHLNQLVLAGKALDAFELYYHDDVIMQENKGITTVGKDANRHREIEFVNSITEFRDAKIISAAADENVSFVKWNYDYTHKDWGVKNYTQVSVQYWKEGKIIKEQFFYSN